MYRIAQFSGIRVFNDFAVGYGLDGGHPRSDATKFRINRFLVEGSTLRAGADKELTTVGGIGTRIRHGDNTRLVREGRGLAGPLVAGSSGSCVCGISGLKHKRSNDPEDFVAVKKSMSS